MYISMRTHIYEIYSSMRACSHELTHMHYDTYVVAYEDTYSSMRTQTHIQQYEDTYI